VKKLRLATSSEIRENLGKLAQMNFEQRKTSDIVILTLILIP